MSRPTLEVADIVRRTGNSFWEQQQSHLAWPHRKVLDAIVRCRTAALGGHRDQCVRCGHQAISFNSCRNRHCPKCQGNARAKWLAARSAELLPVPYFHVVFTLPHELSALVLQNKRLLYDLLYRTSAATMLELARDPKHLGADIGFLGVLHTWGQNLEHHPHVHYIVPAGGLALDGSRWIDSSRRFFLPVHALSRVFRGKFVRWTRSNSSRRASFSFMARNSIWPLPAAFPASSGSYSSRTGSSTPSHPSAAPNMCSTTWPATPIASPSPTIGSWPLKTAASHFAGETMPTAARRRS